MKKKVFELKVEVNANQVRDPKPLGNSVLITPPIGEDYWLLRVPVSKNQAVVCFPKFGTIGVGFQKETDWNTNLPYSCEAIEIFNHIAHNKGTGNIPDSRCLEAIKLLQTTIKEKFEIDGKLQLTD